MNDGLNDTYGTLGTGTLTGKLNYHVESQGNGNITVYLDSVELYTYSYTAYRPNYAVNQNLNFHVYTLAVLKFTVLIILVMIPLQIPLIAQQL